MIAPGVITRSYPTSTVCRAAMSCPVQGEADADKERNEETDPQLAA